MTDTAQNASVNEAFAYPDQFSTEMDLPLFEGAPKTYLIASTPRCGSHYLGHALTAMGGFGVPLEYLNKGNFSGWKARFGNHRLPGLLCDIIRHRTSPNGRFGIKAHWSQFSPHIGTDRLAPLGTIERVIHIYRGDLLGQAISFEKANQTGQWISGAPAKGKATYRYGKIVKAAENLRSQNLAWAAYLADHEGEVLRLDYASLIAAPEFKLTEIRDFLDPESTAQPQPSERTQKQSDGLSKQWRERFLDDMRPEHAWIAEPFALE
ncbi:Stf0 family sulfotransferase [Celeribacter sp.]|uniref:Stf0 family sulfotransferase n=1 Tax=Celeribacter sp. TaxID=1890673 RepID=UPI003A93E736